MTDGSTFKVPSALRIPGNHVLLERDPANHPVYLVRNAIHCHGHASLVFFFLDAPSAISHFPGHLFAGDERL